MAGRGRPKKDKPITNINAADAADALRRASGKIVQAEEAVDAAKAPLRDAKAVVKATGIDYDIFALIHKIRTLDDDAKRQSRIHKLKLTCAALLDDVVCADLFSGNLTVSLSPAAAQSLRDASDALEGAEEYAHDDGGARDDFQDAAEAEPWTEPPEPTHADDDPAPITLAADMPSGAGAAFNMGSDAWVAGMDEDDCPFGDDDAKRSLWLRGFRAAEAGDALVDEDHVDEPADCDSDADADVVPPFSAGDCAPALPAAE